MGSIIYRLALAIFPTSLGPSPRKDLGSARAYDLGGSADSGAQRSLHGGPEDGSMLACEMDASVRSLQ